ncbi:uncharacterized protein LOC131332039 [Rhododendron vialii]|uniref:uncharacterized protein LOC131332039 n=1 Tax=Rhododendron vialii TaxID=182163 RepID=UPI00265D9430|nr:uncharacterized protein LOC131332039 [Rhododendron vialii]
MEDALVSVNIEQDNTVHNIVSLDKFSGGPPTTNDATASTFANESTLQTQETGCSQQANYSNADQLCMLYDISIGVTARLKANPKIPDQTQNPPVVSQVAAIWNPNEPDGELAERDIRVHTHYGHSQKIQYYYGCYDPVQYPLLFPLGEPGWHQGIKKNTPIRIGQPSQGQTLVLPSNATTAENLIAQEAAVYQNIEDQDAMVSAREFYAYRLQIRPNTNSILLNCGRLLQQFVVDMYVKIETSRLDYFRNKQEEIRFDLYQGIVDSVNQGESQGSRVGTKTVLPRSFIGGPQDMQKRYLDAMALVQKFGKPDIFLTMTCNPAWPEIKNELKPHEEAQNRPDLLVRVFKSKLEQMRKGVIKEELFGPIAAYTYAVEFQKRGLPHVHLLIILKRPYKLNTADKFNAIISAEIPHREHQPHLYATVLKHMMHGPCGDLDKNRACMKDGECKYRYPRDYYAETTVSEDGYPIYWRCQNNDEVLIRGQMLNNRWVVPYNPYLLARFDCHINVKVCSTIKAVKYLYKYIYKGHDKIIYKLVVAKSNEDIDEIEQFQSARWISPPEAMWRIYGFPLFEIHPAVMTL